jgi:hypothetical protein
MKAIKLLAAVALLCVVSAVSFHLGDKYGQSYKDASRMSDLIRCYDDHLKEDSIKDYGCFEELKNVFLYDDGVGEPINLKDYAYCY